LRWKYEREVEKKRKYERKQKKDIKNENGLEKSKYIQLKNKSKEGVSEEPKYVDTDTY
jgi:hypothetical protein